MAEADLQGHGRGGPLKNMKHDDARAAAIGVPRAGNNFFMPVVNWITHGRTETGA
jgi:hypothetical protein